MKKPSTIHLLRDPKIQREFLRLVMAVDEYRAKASRSGISVREMGESLGKIAGKGGKNMEGAGGRLERCIRGVVIYREIN